MVQHIAAWHKKERQDEEEDGKVMQDDDMGVDLDIQCTPCSQERDEDDDKNGVQDDAEGMEVGVQHITGPRINRKRLRRY